MAMNWMIPLYAVADEVAPHVKAFELVCVLNVAVVVLGWILYLTVRGDLWD
jgi:hypothetical protein